ncbi:MAG: FHA domain-containing protein [Planctomycetales bacterium]
MTRGTLLIIQGIDQGTRFELEERGAGIGRGPLNEICLRDTEASRMHAKLEYRDGMYVLTDLSSSNGTYVNGQAVRSLDLGNGDQIQIGRTILLFKQESRLLRAEEIGAQVRLLSQQDTEDRSQIVGNAKPAESQMVALTAGADQPAGVAQVLLNLQLLYQITEETARPATSLDAMLQNVLNLILQAMGADRGCMLLRNPQGGDLVPRILSPQRMTSEDPMPVSRSIVEYVIKSGQGVRTADARSDTRFETGQSILQAGIREAMCVPIQGHYDLLGVIYLDITTPAATVLREGTVRHRFHDEMLKLLVAIGRQTALAVENQHYQQALVKAERLGAMGQTIAILSHHIKNILQGVRGGSYLIEMGLEGHNEEIVRKGWGIVEKNQNRIYHLVMDMLTFSKERQPAYEFKQLNDVVQDVVELMQARAAEGEVQLQVHLDPDLPLSMFDPEGIHRAVLNVLTNALDAVEGIPQATVRVETGFDAPQQRLFVRVHDNGPGIPPDVAARIFNIFESTKGARGTGLGLPVSQKIIREHGGDIHVSCPPGAGTLFLLEWPKVDEEPHAVESPTQA